MTGIMFPLLLALPLIADDIVEVTNCQNGTFGRIVVSESPALSLVASGGFLRQAQCDSRQSVPRVAPGTCNVSIYGSGAASEISTTPSTTTPVLSYLDLGPQITITGPNGELKLPRSVSGGTTSYSFSSSRLAQPFLVAGRFEVKTEAGRDLPALNLSVDHTPLTITSPASGSSVASSSPPSIMWTGGSESMLKDMDILVLATSRDLRRTYELSCRAAQGSSGEFTLPREAWEQVPSDVRATGLASFVVSARGPAAALSIEGLDGGIQAYFWRFPGVAVVLGP